MNDNCTPTQPSPGQEPHEGDALDCRFPHKKEMLAELLAELVDSRGEFSTAAIHGCYRCPVNEHDLHIAYAAGTGSMAADDLIALITALRSTAASLEKVLLSLPLDHPCHGCGTRPGQLRPAVVP